MQKEVCMTEVISSRKRVVCQGLLSGQGVVLGHLFRETWLTYLVLDLQTLQVREVSSNHVHLELVPGCFWPETILPDGTRVSATIKGALVATGIVEGHEIREGIGHIRAWVNYRVRDVVTGQVVLIAEAWVEPLPE